MNKKPRNAELSKGTRIIKAVFALAPFAMIAVCAVLYFTLFRHVTVSQLLMYTPENIWLASLVLIGMFSLKSLTFFFPMLVIIAACGSISPNILIALLINTIGIFCMMNIPYLIGRFAQKDFVDAFVSKHKKMRSVQNIRMKNEIFFVFFLRVINCLPYDVVSMFLGSVGTSWKTYIAGSMLGTLPGTILSTVMGLYLDDPTSKGFVISLSLNIAVSVISGAAYLIYLHKHKSDNVSKGNNS
ncbi:MAG: VTT domain-containing protein [Oscillospiraceae bacterium]|nr:VTT domain-containing protein [Oscillospiraceae bacterium]